MKGNIFFPPTEVALHSFYVSLLLAVVWVTTTKTPEQGSLEYELSGPAGIVSSLEYISADTSAMINIMIFGLHSSSYYFYTYHCVH